MLLEVRDKKLHIIPESEQELEYFTKEVPIGSTAVMVDVEGEGFMVKKRIPVVLDPNIRNSPMKDFLGM